jgi:NtrC-family two-component system response regulator AlgB
VLIVDRDHQTRKIVRGWLEGLGCRVREGESEQATLVVAARERIDLVFLDLSVGEEGGLDLLSRLIATQPSMNIVIVAQKPSIDTAIEAIHRGAFDYLPTPLASSQVRLVIDRLRADRRTSADSKAPTPAAVTDGPEVGGNFSLEQIEREHILRVMSRAKTMEEAAAILGIDYSTLWRKRKRFEDPQS